MRSSVPSGFTLAEVVVALGLLAGVLIACAGLFVHGQRQIESGRATTAALAAARSILEELTGHGLHSLYRSLGSDGSTSVHRVDTRTDAVAARWQADLRRELAAARAVIELRSLDGRPLRIADGLRVTVTVRWREGARARRLRLAVVRT